MFNRFATFLAVIPLAAVGMYAQGLDTKASPNDWEEVNFEFNSSVLVDGFPSLLRVAELLKNHPGYKVRIEGHTDVLGGGAFNEKLGQARADTVRDFLVKYGASAAQISTGTRGKADPKYPGQKNAFTKTDEARWMNRRVVLTVMDESGRVVGAGGAGDAIRAMDTTPKGGMTDCCSEVLKRLDKLDDIARLLKDLADQNAQLRKEIADLKNNQAVLESKVNQPPPPPMAAPAPAAPPVAKHEDSRFQLLGVNVGADQDHHVTAAGKGRFFGVFGEHYALQAQAEYMYTHRDREGQFDVGLVDRLGRMQAGLFASFKSASLTGMQTNGTLGQAALTFDYIFKWGKLGVFGTKGFKDDAKVYDAAWVNPNTGYVSTDIFLRKYLHIVDQVGVSGTVALGSKAYLEGNIGYLRSTANADRPGGTLRFVFPLNDKFALTVEGGVNESLLGAGNLGRAEVGFQMGNLMRPKEMLASGIPVPVDVPRVRYEVLTRKVHVGETPPVADAGPDQLGIPAGTVTLNGSNSYSPDGNPLTYQWIQEGGPTVSLSAPTAAVTTFTATGNQSYTFRLVVKDNYGGQGSSRVHITTASSSAPIISSFTANPTSITSGQAAVLAWSVSGATTVSISSVGAVQPSGTASVSPTATTTYTLTATNANGSTNATATVVVNTPQTQMLACYASPANIMVGESATLNYQSQNATSVAITPGVGAVGLSGSVAVSPTSSTTYTVTATGANNQTASCSIAVQVTAGALPRIVQFSASPLSILSGQSTTLVWVVDNATSQTITTLGTVVAAGSQSISPTATTTYTLTATNNAGSVNATVTVTVTQIPNPVIVSFTASPNPSTTPGAPVVLSCSTQNTASITMAGLTFLPPIATYTVYPQATTSYNCIATGENGVTATKSVTVTVGSTAPPAGQPPVIVIAGGSTQTTTVRTVLIDASGSSSPSGNNPLSYSLAVLYGSAETINANTSKPTVVLGAAPGPYYFNLTVTDSKGMSTTQEITIIYQP
ncbi:MAG TPA: OmpA family protein [Bryobacteraceae bacterium]|nr:OmpA family protein [Bryobacteraceae bacterium]